ncbi:phosphomevalonate kinase [Streptococcus cameli]
MRVQASAPGKLFLAGEYAVVEPGNLALIAAIDQYITVSVSSAVHGTIYSSQQGKTISWIRKGGQIVVATAHDYQLILSAMQVVEDYVSDRGVALSSAYAVHVETELDNQESGQKYGLGSSGAVTVATVRAVLAFYGQNLPAEQVFRLAVLAQMRLEMAGSFGDMAASSFGGVVFYQSLDKAWLKARMEQESILSLLKMPWQGLKIGSVSLPDDLSLLIGWTHQVAKTDDFVGQVQDRKHQLDKKKAHADFLEKSRICVEKLIASCQDQEVGVFQEQIRENRGLLRQFSKEMAILIETRELEKLCTIAAQHGAVAKSSGAGGGDCGICFVEQKEQKEAIINAWQKAGIVPLPFKIAEIE